MAKLITGAKLSDYKFDDKNANRHTERGTRLLEKSLSKLGAARSVVADKNNVFVAGNGVAEKWGEIGNDAKVVVVETDGTELVVVKRTDVSINSKKGRELAIADNQTAKVGIDFDLDVLEDLRDEFDVDLGEWELEAFGLGEEALNVFFEKDNTEPKEETGRIVLNYALEEIETVKKALLRHGKTYEQAIWNLLGL